MLSRTFELKRDQILVLIAKDFKLKYNSTALGFLWSLLVPIFSSIIYYFVFGIMLRFNAQNYLLFLLSGTFLWQFFANVVMMNGGVMMGNAALLKKTSFDKRLLIWGTFFTEGIHLLLTVPILVGLMFFYKITPDWLTFLPNLAVCLVLLAFFAIGLSYIYAATNIYFQDLERIMMLIMQAWSFITPLFIPPSSVPLKYHWIYKVNPMAGIVQIWRDVFYAPGFHPQSWLSLTIVSLGVFLFGRWLFNRMQNRFAEMM
ncbi:MAG: ABC transporter permease [Lentisphaeria bacterium]|nr:ABC transporter permease [Lentisphaeria bacterium]